VREVAILLLGLGLLVIPGASHGSDHADPINLKVLEAGLTDLFAFPDRDQLVVVLATRRALTAAPPYQLEPYEYAIYMDLHSRLTFDDAQHRARYGGTVVAPEGIAPDVTIKIRLNNDATLRDKSFAGLRNPDSIRLFTGVRDDPFIFPKFFKRNAIVMVLSIPFAAFPAGQQDWLLWGTSAQVKDGAQIDHVGRSNRTQLGRFDFLNTLPPSKHVAAIRERHRATERVQKFLMECFPPVVNAFQPLFTVRSYDHVPDVMIFTRRYPVGFPNGRRLTDDVALLTCQQGECPLIENSFIDSEQWPRATANDKPFLASFPYLAEPWPAVAQPAPASIGVRAALAAIRDIAVFSLDLVGAICSPLMVVLGAVAVAGLIALWLLSRWCRGRNPGVTGAGPNRRFRGAGTVSRRA
jgi:hypothetical protein